MANTTVAIQAVCRDKKKINVNFDIYELFEVYTAHVRFKCRGCVFHKFRRVYDENIAAGTGGNAGPVRC